MASDAGSPLLQLIDLRQYQAVSDALGSDLASLVTEFFSDCEGFAASLAARAAAGDAAGFRELCHEIKGAAAQLGFCGISACAARWETLSAGGEMTGIAGVAEAFLPLVAQTRARLDPLPSPSLIKPE